MKSPVSIRRLPAVQCLGCIRVFCLKRDYILKESLERIIEAVEEAIGANRALQCNLTTQLLLCAAAHVLASSTLTYKGRIVEELFSMEGRVNPAIPTLLSQDHQWIKVRLRDQTHDHANGGPLPNKSLAAQ